MSSRGRGKAAPNFGAWRAARRRQLDLHLGGLDERLGPHPGLGWIRMIREALGMSGRELGVRLGVSRQRVDQLEQAEVARTMPISTLDRVAAALGCRVRYVLVPLEPLEQMVRRQALRRAAAAITGPSDGDDRRQVELLSAKIEVLADALVDQRGLWGAAPPRWSAKEGA